MFWLLIGFFKKKKKKKNKPTNNTFIYSQNNFSSVLLLFPVNRLLEIFREFLKKMEKRASREVLLQKVNLCIVAGLLLVCSGSFILCVKAGNNNVATTSKLRFHCYFEEEKRVILVEEGQKYSVFIDSLKQELGLTDMIVKYQDGKN